MGPFANFVSIHRCKMLMPKRDRVLIYEHLFREGVLVAKKDVFLPCHPEFDNVKNLHVMKACKSLKSRGLVKENYTWSHYYYSLTNEVTEKLTVKVVLTRKLMLVQEWDSLISVVDTEEDVDLVVHLQAKKILLISTIQEKKAY